MSTVIRTDISPKGKYYISKHRYLELKHFCAQYPEWKREYYELSKEGSLKGIQMNSVSSSNLTDLTFQTAAKLLDISNRINLVERCAKEADDEIWTYLVKSVTEERSYPYLQTVADIPCGKDLFYDRYRKFFYILSEKRDSVYR